MNFLSKLKISEINQKQNFIILMIILLSWVHQWLSIGSFINTDYQNFSLGSILTYRNQSLLIFVINLFIFIFNKKKKKENRIYFYFFLIPITYLLGFVNLYIDTPNEKNLEFFYYLTFILQMLNTLLVLTNFSKIFGIDKAILLKINLLLICIYGILMIDFSNLKIFYHVNFLDSKIITNQNGASRILSILGSFITCYYFVKKQNVTYLLFIFIINYLIINTESRQVLVLVITQLVVTIYICFQKNEIIKKILLYLFLLIIIPLILNVLIKKNLQNNRLFLFQGDYKNIEQEFQVLGGNLKNLQEDKKTFWINKNLEEDKFKDNQRSHPLKIINNFLTGRIFKWDTASKHIINSKIKNILFGNGPQFDRKIETRSEDIASGIFYIFLCGGLLGMLVFFLIIKKILKIISYAFNNKKKMNTDVYYCLSINCIISLTLRTFIENGFLIYGVDFLIITSSIFYVTKSLKTI